LFSTHGSFDGQGSPSLAGLNSQAPVSGLQDPSEQASGEVHFFGAPSTHCPCALHVASLHLLVPVHPKPTFFAFTLHVQVPHTSHTMSAHPGESPSGRSQSVS
jgi:hypothetical protein